MSQAIALDELAVGSPLLLELRQGRGIHHGAGGLKLMDVHVDQARLPPPVRQKDLSLCIPYLILPNALVKLERVSPIKCSSRINKWIIAFAYLGGILLDIVSIPILSSLEP